MLLYISRKAQHLERGPSPLPPGVQIQQLAEPYMDDTSEYFADMRTQNVLPSRCTVNVLLCTSLGYQMYHIASDADAALLQRGWANPRAFYASLRCETKHKKICDTNKSQIELANGQRCSIFLLRLLHADIHRRSHLNSATVIKLLDLYIATPPPHSVYPKVAEKRR